MKTQTKHEKHGSQVSYFFQDPLTLQERCEDTAEKDILKLQKYTKQKCIFMLKKKTELSTER